MRCPHCNLEHPDDSLFCPTTGRPMGNAVQPPPSSQATPGMPAQPASPGTRKGLPKEFWLILTIVGGLCVLLVTAAVLALAYWNGAFHGQAVPAGTSQAGRSGEVAGRIAFVSNREGPSEIYVMDAEEGAFQTRLTSSSTGVHNDYPAWSPDGRKIAFVSDRGGDAEIYVMDADGSHPTLLRDIPAHKEPYLLSTYSDFHPTWSPDGQRIAFVSNLDGLYKICIMGADGSHPACIPGSQVGNLDPDFLLEENSTYPQDDRIGLSWCPDGQSIVYGSSRSGSYRIYVISIDGSSQTSLSKDQQDIAPACSRDGLKIAFVSYQDSGLGLYLMNFDGGERTALFKENKGYSNSPSWSPDGGSLVFQSNRDGNSEIYRVNIDGSDLTRLTDNPAQDYHPAWSPATP